MSQGPLFNPNSKNCGGKHMIFTQQRNHLKAIVNSESVLKIDRPHAHVDSRKKSKRPLQLKKYDYYKEIARTFNKIQNIKKSEIDNSAPKSYYMKHVRNAQGQLKDDHNLNLQSMVKHLDEIDSRANRIRPHSAAPSTKFSLRKPLDMLPTTMYSGAYLEKSNKFKKSNNLDSMKFFKPNKIQAHLPSDDYHFNEYSQNERSLRDEEYISSHKHKAFMHQIKEDLVYDSAASKFMILKRKIYEYIVENRILGEEQLSQVEKAAIQAYPDISPKMISEFFHEIKTFLKRPLSK